MIHLWFLATMITRLKEIQEQHAAYRKFSIYNQNGKEDAGMIPITYICGRQNFLSEVKLFKQSGDVKSSLIPSKTFALWQHKGLSELENLSLYGF